MGASWSNKPQTNEPDTQQRQPVQYKWCTRQAVSEIHDRCSGKQQRIAALVLPGALNPVHRPPCTSKGTPWCHLVPSCREHTRSLVLARAQLELEGFSVVAGFLQERANTSKPDPNPDVVTCEPWCWHLCLSVSDHAPSTLCLWTALVGSICR